MKTAPLSRRERLRQILADLRMPGALEASRFTPIPRLGSH